MPEHICKTPITEDRKIGELFTCYECGTVYELCDDAEYGRIWESVSQWEPDDAE